MSGSDDLLLHDNRSQRFTSSGMPMELVVLEVLVDPDLEVDSEVDQDSVEDLDSEVELRLSEPHPLLMESTKNKQPQSKYSLLPQNAMPHSNNNIHFPFVAFVTFMFQVCYNSHFP
jgi:hypothetical protein